MQVTKISQVYLKCQHSFIELRDDAMDVVGQIQTRDCRKVDSADQLTLFCIPSYLIDGELPEVGQTSVGGGGWREKSEKLWAGRRIHMSTLNSIVMCFCCLGHLLSSPTSMDHTVEISGIHSKGRSIIMVSVK